MFRFVKVQLISYIAPFLLLCSPVSGQVETVNFLWTNKDNKESNGTIALQWQKNQTMGYWELQLNVKWYDPAGKDISDPEIMPFIYLSDYDIEIDTDEVKCLNFSVSDNIYEIFFQDRGELRFDIPSGIQNPGIVHIIFRYSLSQEDIANANIDPVRIPGRQKISIDLPDTSIREDISHNEENNIQPQQIVKPLRDA